MLAAACGSSGSKSATQTLKVEVDGKDATHNESFLAYYPKELKAHPGDSITFDNVGNGEPHTVTFGTLVNTAVSKFLANPQATEPPPEDVKLPVLLPNGPGDAVQAAAVKCALATGDPPTKDACTTEQQKVGDFTGTETYYNSGWLAPNDSFSMKLSSTLKPGDYTYMCLLHREGMVGKLTVVAKGTDVPSASEQTATGKSENAATAAKLKPAADALATGTVPGLDVVPKGPNNAVAGSGALDVQDAFVSEFGPKDVSIATGGSVTWTVVGGHTISFNAPEDAKQVRVNGTHLNEKAVAPAGEPGQAPPDPNAPPPDPNAPPKPPTITDGGAFDGTGFRSTGIIFSDPSALAGYKLTFTKAGTYAYKCLIHDNMEGTVKVG